MATFSELRIGGSLMCPAKGQGLLSQKLRLSQKLMPHGFPQHSSKKPFFAALSLVGERRDLAVVSPLNFLPLPALFGKLEFITLKKAKVQTILQTDRSTIFIFSPTKSAPFPFKKEIGQQNMSIAPPTDDSWQDLLLLCIRLALSRLKSNSSKIAVQKLLGPGLWTNAIGDSPGHLPQTGGKRPTRRKKSSMIT